MKNKGLIIINLGSPDSYSVQDVRAYLNQFLMDKRVIDMPALLRYVVVKGFIVPFRAPKSAEAYKTVWTDRGSPLKVITDDFKRLVEQKVSMPVAVAMRYGNPGPAAALKELESKTDGLEEILIAPMYPHYAMSSYETALDYVKDYILGVRKDVKIKVLKPFYNDPAYIESLAASVKPYVDAGNFDAYLFSYHGLPVRHLKKSDTTNSHCYSSGECCEIKSMAWQTCYKHQVKVTTKLVTESLKLDSSKVLISFQSRLSSGWIEPFTDKLLEELPAKGVKKLMILCPAFVADCLETLEEISIRGKETFLQNGGEQFVAVPCLNTQPRWVDTFADYVNNYDGGNWHLWQ